MLIAFVTSFLAETKVQGFYDLEMVRIGTEAHQLGVLVSLCHLHCLDRDWLDWPNFLESYEASTGRTLTEEDFRSILAMHHFYHHLRISDWGRWAETKEGAIGIVAARADEDLLAMRWACHALRKYVDLGRWFPSLEL